MQLLRAFAALFVVGFHTTVLWRDKFDPMHVPWQNGNSGVDLFFVISGFIMVVSSRKLLNQTDGWRRFITLRLIRLTPMYWLATAMKLAAVIAVPAMALHTRPNEWNSIASFLFIPARDAVGNVRPVLDVGWTLSFEMLFYLVFAFALSLKIDVLLVVAPTMAMLALTSLAVRPEWIGLTTLANPIVLEFAFGAFAARWLLGSRVTLLPSYVLPLASLGLVCLAFIPTYGAWGRMAVWGSAATVTLTASVAGERFLGRLVPEWCIKIGEASYSLYLTHGFVLPVLGAILVKSRLEGSELGMALIMSCLVSSTVAALIVYRFIEKPLTDWLRQVVQDSDRTTLGSPKQAI